MIDLMPQSCRETLGRRSWVRRWALVYLCLGSIVAGGWFWMGSGGSARRAFQQDLRAERDLRLEQNVKAQELVAEIALLEGAIRRYNRLAWPVRISSVIDTLGAFAPEQITLTSFALTPREIKTNERGSDSRGNRGTSSKHLRRSILVVEAEGVAPDDHVIAVLVSKLEAHAMFSSVSLDFARSHKIDETDGRAFRVTCVIDLEARYEFADAGGAP